MDLLYNRKIMKICGLSKVPTNRKIFDTRFVTISTEIKNRITTIGELFVHDEIINPFLLTVNPLIKVKGHVWHKSSMRKKIVPHSCIDIDARGRFSHTKGLDIWIQTTFDIKYWFNYSSIGSRFYNCQYTGQPGIQHIDNKKST